MNAFLWVLFFAIISAANYHFRSKMFRRLDGKPWSAEERLTWTISGITYVISAFAVVLIVITSLF